MTKPFTATSRGNWQTPYIIADMDNSIVSASRLWPEPKDD